MEIKKLYITPHIESILLDNEMSLALESAPPAGPDESLQSTQYNQYNPFKSDTTLV